MHGFLQTNGSFTITATPQEWNDVLQDIDHARYRSGVAMPGSKELENMVDNLIRKAHDQVSSV